MMIKDNKRKLHTSSSSIPIGIRSSVGLWGKVHDAHTSMNSPGTHEFTTWSNFLSTLPASIWTIYIRTVVRREDQGEPNGKRREKEGRKEWRSEVKWDAGEKASWEMCRVINVVYTKSSMNLLFKNANASIQRLQMADRIHVTGRDLVLFAGDNTG